MALADPDDLAQALGIRAAILQAALLDTIEANLSGAVLQERTGALKASVQAALAGSDGGATVAVESTGVPYAAIQEYGGQTPPHDIVPVKARALAFAGVFARRVHHPGSHLPARAPFGRALDALRDDIRDGLEAAVRDALDPS
jgi:phage gpG-like protein